MSEGFTKGLNLSMDKSNVDPLASRLKIGIIRAQWNEEIIQSLYCGCMKQLEALGVTDVTTWVVPGSFELPSAAKNMIEGSEAPFDAVVCIGCLIKGDTMHFEYIADATANGIMQVGVSTGVPVLFGVLTCLNDEQARVRAGFNGHNHGDDWGGSAVAMGLIRLKFRERRHKRMVLRTYQIIGIVLIGLIVAVLKTP